MDTRTRDTRRGTQTAVGWVPHLPMRTAEGLEFEAPVKLVRSLNPKLTKVKGENVTYWFEPATVGGELVFALPGGGEILDAALPPQSKRG